ncbi:MAG TPA: nucleoside hydrolase [Planctomycetes bacterium]|nr:nucleoside hydrolase [Planctomycetota bacterium]
MAARIPVILDTDIGSDIDDAVALAYLLSEPACELLGVTTVTGDVEKRSRLAGYIADVAGRGDLPIRSGLSEVMLFGPGQPEVPQYEAIEKLPHRKDFAKDAVVFLRDTIRSRPGEIVLLTIGPLTNIGALFTADPEIPSMLKALVMMCGVFTAGGQFGPGRREWNALVDPVATAITYRARPKQFASVGLEVTTRCTMDAGEVRRKFTEAGPLMRSVLNLAEVWFRSRPRLCFHDPLASVYVFDPDVLKMCKGTVTVETTSRELGGLTSFQPAKDDEPAPHDVAVNVDVERFFAKYFKTVVQ